LSSKRFANCKLQIADLNLFFMWVGREKANLREPKSSLCPAFNFKLGRFRKKLIALHRQTHAHLELKTRPRFSPVSFFTPKCGLYQHFYNFAYLDRPSSPALLALSALLVLVGLQALSTLSILPTSPS
jgi:hypothetical protein